MNIMLACCAGMSTSILVNAMEKAAADQGKDYKIWADNTTAVEMCIRDSARPWMFTRRSPTAWA